MTDEKKEVERTPYCPMATDVADDNYPTCDGPYCGWWSPEYKMCSRRLEAESLAALERTIVHYAEILIARLG